MTITGLGWFNLGWLLLDLAIVAILIPTVLLQRRESGATLAWILAILLVPFLGLLAYWPSGYSAQPGCACASLPDAAGAKTRRQRASGRQRSSAAAPGTGGVRQP